MNKAKAETGCASFFISLEDGEIDVQHGEGERIKTSTLFHSKVKKGTWDRIWKAIEGGKIK